MPVAFSISVLSRDRRSKAFKRRTADPSNLRPVMHQSKIAVETKCNSIKLAFLNTRSLKNKSFVINDLITTNNMDFMFLIETWLHEFTLTFNLKAIVSIFWLAVLGEGSKPGIWPEPRELPRPRCGMK